MDLDTYSENLSVGCQLHLGPSLPNHYHVGFFIGYWGVGMYFRTISTYHIQVNLSLVLQYPIALLASDCSRISEYEARV